MELRHLRYFVAVAALHNFTRAARRLRVAQPALSRQIRDLEEEVGTPLLERGRPLRLTAAGAAFLPEAEAILARAAGAIEQARLAAKQSRQQLKVGYAPTPSVEILPCALHVFQNAQPHVQVQLHDLSSEEMLRGLHEGRLEVCLMVRPTARALRGLVFTPAREYPLVAAFAPRHPLAKKRRLAVADLATEPLLGFPREGYPDYHELVSRVFGGQPPTLAEEHDSGPGLLAAAEIGRGWMLGPACLASQVGGRLAIRPIHPPPEPVVVGTVHREGHLSPAGAAFVRAASLEPRTPTT